jgi:hypothetical protein
LQRCEHGERIAGVVLRIAAKPGEHRQRIGDRQPRADPCCLVVSNAHDVRLWPSSHVAMTEHAQMVAVLESRTPQHLADRPRRLFGQQDNR